MSSPAAALPAPTPAKLPKRRSKSQKKKTGPTVSDLILKAASASKERGGVSLVALKRALKTGGYDVVKNRARILVAIKRLVANKSLVQIKGTGASGSFKLNKKPPAPRKKKVVKKKSKAKKVKKTRVKKTAEGATPMAKKSKKKKAKSPKKAKKPAAAKKPKKSKSPKKPKSRVTKSVRTRAAAKK